MAPPPIQSFKLNYYCESQDRTFIPHGSQNLTFILNVPWNHLESLISTVFCDSCPEILIQQVWTRVHEFAFLMSSRVTPMLLCQGPHFEDNCPGEWKQFRHISMTHQIITMWVITAREWKSRKQISSGQSISASARGAWINETARDLNIPSSTNYVLRAYSLPQCKALS